MCGGKNFAVRCFILLVLMYVYVHDICGLLSSIFKRETSILHLIMSQTTDGGWNVVAVVVVP